MALALLLSLAGPARAAPEDALSPATRRLYAAAQQAEGSGDPRTAESGYRAVLRADSEFMPARLGLARALVDAQRPEAALAVLEGAPFDAAAVEARGKLLLTLERWEDATDAFVRLGRLSPESEGALLLQAEALWHADPSTAAERIRTWVDHPNSRLDAHAARVAVEVADALRAEDVEPSDPTREHALLELVKNKDPEAGSYEVLVERLARYDVEKSARDLARAGSEPLTADVRGQLDRARLAFADGDVEQAKRALAPLVRAHPMSAELMATWADVLRESGDVQGSEHAFRAAMALEPLEPAHPRGLGLLLLEHYGGLHADEAVSALAAAVRLRPGSAELWALLADAHWAEGQIREAEQAYGRALDLGAGDWTQRAERRRGPSVLREAHPAPPEISTRESSLPLAYWVARVYAARGQTEEALVELSALRDEGVEDPSIDELEASLALAAGEVARAEALYRAALESRPDEPRLLAALGDLVLTQGRDAEALGLLRRAADLPGGAAARLPLARHAMEEWRLWEAQEHLELYFAGETGGPDYDSALALRALTESRKRSVWAGAVGGSALLVMLPVGALVRRRRGISTEQLISLSPRAFADLAPVLSALRHEVLKHNASLLEPVAEALELGDEALVMWATERLFEDGGVVRRFEEQCARVQAIGVRHGATVNLVHVDPLFGPALAAIKRLAGLQRDLQRMRVRAAAPLREIADVLNRRTYSGLGRLLAKGQCVTVDDTVVAAAWDDVQAEPSRRGKTAVPLVIELAPDLLVRGDHGDLHDVLCNLFRNALQAEATRMAVVTEVEEDWVTGLESVVLKVADDAPGRVTTEQIRGRFIERGLGLVVDLVHRFKGSVAVVNQPGYAKAIAVRLPRAEVIEEVS